MSDEIDEMLTVKDVQRILRLGRDSTYNLVRMESFPKIQINSQYRIPRSAFVKWVNTQIKNKVLI